MPCHLIVNFPLLFVNNTFNKRILSKHTRKELFIILSTTQELTWLSSVPLFHRPPRIQAQRVPDQNIFVKYQIFGDSTIFCNLRFAK